jgi:hypothetical protein
MTEHTSTVQSKERWYVTGKREVVETPWEKARKSCGLYGVQMLRLRKLAKGEPLSKGDLKLCDKGFMRFCAIVSARIEWLQIIRAPDRKWTVNNPERLREFLGMEE